MAKGADWYSKVAALIAGGKTQREAAAEAGVSQKTLRRHLAASDGLLRGLVDHARARVAEADADELGQLRGKALAVLEHAIEGGDIAAAKAVLGKLVANPADAPPLPEQEEEITAEAAYKEVVASLPAAADLVRCGAIGPELAAQLRRACEVFLADDLKPRPPIDCSAERIEVGTASEVPEQQSEEGGASVIPIR